jgi:hypothetical protein
MQESIELNEDFKQAVYKKYMQTVICNDIKEIRKAKHQKIVEYIGTILFNNLDVEDFTVSESDIEIIYDLTDIADFMSLQRAINAKYDIVDNYTRSVFESIQNGIEAFYSLPIKDRINHLEKGKKHSNNGLFNDPYSNYFSVIYGSIIDTNSKGSVHSGFSFGYCVKHVGLFVSNDKEHNIELWAKLIVSYLLKK